MHKPGFVDPRGLHRYLLAVGAALVLHLALLTPLRFPVNGAATVAAPTSMLVRMLEPAEHAQASAERLPSDPPPAPESVVPPPRVSDSTPAGRSPAISRRSLAPDASRHGVATEPASPATPQTAVPLVTDLKPAPRPPGLAPAPNYRMSGLLDPGPQPLHDITPEYPVRAGQQQGVVVLRLLINEQGLVDNVAVVRSEPKGFFEESALEAYGQARFSPGMLLGLPVKSQMLIEVLFATENRGASVSGRTY